MRIEKLYYRNHVTGWELSPMEFGDVNLLVGVSGVGKTKILEAIRSLQKIVVGSIRNNNGVEWDISFSIAPDKNYRWKGKVNILNNYLETEALFLNNCCITSRNDGIIKFEDQIMPKLSQLESLIRIFKLEDKIIPVIHGISLIVDSQTQHRKRSRGSSSFNSSSNSNKKNDKLSLSDIRNASDSLGDMLRLLKINYRDVFDRVKADFINIFPQVEDFRISTQYLKLQMNETPFPVFSLDIKELNVDRWITQPNISTGMLKTLTHIVEIYLLAEGSILLIDEFENSLGVNCIDVVTELLSDRKDIQFIITSHHPYIINKIPMQYWKIITRKGSVVTATNATDYEELSGSRHKAFTQLINLPDYTEGIQVG
jgi:predicted ATPase